MDTLTPLARTGRLKAQFHESLIGEKNAGECVKLEIQVAVTASGAQRLDSFPWEEF